MDEQKKEPDKIAKEVEEQEIPSIDDLEEPEMSDQGLAAAFEKDEKDTEIQKITDPILAVDPHNGFLGGARYCQRCNWDTAVNTLSEPTDEEKQEFLKTAVLGNKCYRKEYSLFGGQFKVVMETRTLKEQDCIKEQVEIDRAKGRYESQASEFAMVERYQMTTSVKSIVLRAGKVIDLDAWDCEGFYEILKEKLDSVKRVGEYVSDLDVAKDTVLFVAAREKWKKLASSVLFRSLILVNREFEALIGVLSSRVLTADFWKAGPAQ